MLPPQMVISLPDRCLLTRFGLKKLPARVNVQILSTNQIWTCTFMLTNVTPILSINSSIFQRSMEFTSKPLCWRKTTGFFKRLTLAGNRLQNKPLIIFMATEQHGRKSAGFNKLGGVTCKRAGATLLTFIHGSFSMKVGQQ